MDSVYDNFKSKSKFLRIIEDMGTAAPTTGDTPTVDGTGSASNSNPAAGAAAQASAAAAKATSAQAQAMINLHNSELQKWQAVLKTGSATGNGQTGSTGTAPSAPVNPAVAQQTSAAVPS